MNKIYVENFRFTPKGFTGIVESYNGDLYWVENGELYQRENDLPSIHTANGDKYWYKKGKLHRENGPAVEYSSGIKEWWIEGKQYYGSMFCQKELIWSLKKKIFLGKEKGKYDLDWLKFMTETGIEEMPLIPGLEFDNRVKPFLDKLF